MTASGSELANQTQILTAAHVDSGSPQTTVIFNLERNGVPVDIPITIPSNAAAGAANPNFLFPAAPLAYNPTTLANDISVINLRDNLPGLPASAVGLRLIAPFSPYENGYSIVAPGAFPQTFNMVGYGLQGTAAPPPAGTGGEAQVSPIGTKTLGRNEFDQTLPAAGNPGAFALNPAGNPNTLEYDFDGGGVANVFGSAGLGGNFMVNGANAPWLNESGLAHGDSGSPALVSALANGSTSSGITPFRSTTELQIAGVASWLGNGFSGFGGFGGYIAASAYNNLPAPGSPQGGFIYRAQDLTPYGAILDMYYQVLGADRQPTSSPAPVNAGLFGIVQPATMPSYIRANARLLIDAGQPNQEIVTVAGINGTRTQFAAPFTRNHAANFTIAPVQDPLTITVGRGTAYPNPVFDANGPNLLIQVTDTAEAANSQYNGFYFSQPLLSNATGDQLITSLMLRGNDGNDTFNILGNLGIPITIIGGAGSNSVVYNDTANSESTYYIVNESGAGAGAVAALRTLEDNVPDQQVTAWGNISSLSVYTGNGDDQVIVQSTVAAIPVSLRTGSGTNDVILGFGSSGFPVGKFVRINTYVDRFGLEIHWVSRIGGGYRSSPPQ